jgi:hypothetical protein
MNADIGFKSFAESFLSFLMRDDTIFPSWSDIPMIFQCKERSLVFFDRPSVKNKIFGSTTVRIQCLRNGWNIAETILRYFEIVQSMRWLWKIELRKHFEVWVKAQRKSMNWGRSFKKRGYFRRLH